MSFSSHFLLIGGANNTKPVERTWGSRDSADLTAVAPPIADGSAVSAWSDDVAALQFIQATGASQPLAEAGDMPGLTALKFDSAQNMAATLPPGFKTGIIAMLVRFDGLGSGESRVLLTRDTSVATTKPAWAVEVSVA